MTGDKGTPPLSLKREMTWLLLALMILVGLALRTCRMDSVSIDLDEAWAPWYAAQPLDGSFLRNISINESHPPAYYLALHALFGISGGDRVLAARYFSVICGLASILLLYWTGRTLFDERAGLLSALIVAVSPFHVYYSQYARDYTLLSALVLISTVCFLKGLRGGRWYWMGGYVLATLVSFYTNYFAILAVFGQYAFLLMRFRRHRAFIMGRYIPCQLAILVLSLPLVFILKMQMVTATEIPMTLSDRFGSSSILYALYKVFYSVLERFNLGVAPLPAMEGIDFSLQRILYKASFLFGVLVFGIPLLRGLRDAGKNEGTLFGVLFVLVPLLFLTIIWIFFPYLYKPRYALFAALGYYLLAAKGLAAYAGRWTRPAGCVLIVLVSFFALSNVFIGRQYMRVDIRGALEYIAADYDRKRDLVIVYPRDTWLAVEYYNRGMSMDIRYFPSPFDPGKDVRKDHDVTRENVRELSNMAEGYGRLWLLNASPGRGSSFLLEDWMRSNYRALGKRCGFYLGPPGSPADICVAGFERT